MTFEEAQKFFENDRYGIWTGCRLTEVGEHHAKAEVELKDMHKNAQGGVMGGVMFTLADFTFAASENNPDSYTCNVSSSINFMSMPKGSKLFAESKMIKDGKSTCFYEIMITDSEGRKIAQVQIMGMHLGKAR